MNFYCCFAWYWIHYQACWLQHYMPNIPLVFKRHQSLLHEFHLLIFWLNYGFWARISSHTYTHRHKEIHNTNIQHWPTSVLGWKVNGSFPLFSLWFSSDLSLRCQCSLIILCLLYSLILFEYKTMTALRCFFALLNLIPSHFLRRVFIFVLHIGQMFASEIIIFDLDIMDTDALWHLNLERENKVNR